MEHPIEPRTRTFREGAASERQSSYDAIASGRRRYIFNLLKHADVALASVRFEAHYGLKSDIALSPESATTRHQTNLIVCVCEERGRHIEAEYLGDLGNLMGRATSA